MDSFKDVRDHIEDNDLEIDIETFTHFSQKELDKLQNIFTLALETNKKDSKANLALAAIYYAKENYQKANIHSYISLLSEPNNKKALMIKFLSLFKLKKYREAQALSCKLDENDKLIKEVSEIIQKEVNSMLHSGILMEMMLENKKGTFELDSKYEYENKKVKLIHDKEKGMKVVARREIVKGEIICISKPIVVYEYPKSEPKFNVIPPNITKELFNKLHFLLYSKFNDSNKIKEQFLSLYDGSNQEYSIEERSKDVDYSDEKILLILSHNIITPRYPSYFSTKVSTGLWYLPSFFNHSCLSNVIYFGIGDCLILVAEDTIKKGQELTISYEVLGTNYLSRCFELNTKYGFTCKCSLCLDERKRLVQQNTIQKKLFNYLQKFEDNYSESDKSELSIKEVDSIKAFVSYYEDKFNWYELSAMYYHIAGQYMLVNSSLALSLFKKAYDKACEGNNFLMKLTLLDAINSIYSKEKNKKELKENQKEIDKLLKEVFLSQQFRMFIRKIETLELIENTEPIKKIVINNTITINKTKVVYRKK